MILFSGQRSCTDDSASLVSLRGLLDALYGLLFQRQSNELRVEYLVKLDPSCGELLNESRELQEVSTEVVGNLSPLRVPLFVRDILRRFLRRVSLATPTSAPVRF
jgi:hypothetical protein